MYSNHRRPSPNYHHLMVDNSPVSKPLLGKLAAINYSFRSAIFQVPACVVSAIAISSKSHSCSILAITSIRLNASTGLVTAPHSVICLVFWRYFVSSFPLKKCNEKQSQSITLHLVYAANQQKTPLGALPDSYRSLKHLHISMVFIGIFLLLVLVMNASSYSWIISFADHQCNINCNRIKDTSSLFHNYFNE